MSNNSDKAAFGSEHSIGLTKREYFAGQALAGMVANTTSTRNASRREIAEGCVIFADALLLALGEGVPQPNARPQLGFNP
tara:strand:- start:37649 stop:37888 length:240 start_codon:yes stop_codon:yes gene_type:complete